MSKLKNKQDFLLLGNGEFAKAAYTSAIDNGCSISTVICSKDESQVGYWYPSGNINSKVYKISNINDKEFYNVLRETSVSVAFVIGWTQLIREPVLSMFNWYGLHCTLLPYGRGRAPIPNTILDNKINFGGVSFFRLTSGVDDGDLIFQKKIKLDERETATSLYYKIFECVYANFSKILHNIENGNLVSLKQAGEPSYYPKRTPDMSKICFKTMHGELIDRMVRAMSDPFPNAFVYVKTEGKLRKISFKSVCILDKPFPDNAEVKFTSEREIEVKTMDGVVLLLTISDKDEPFTEAECRIG